MARRQKKIHGTGKDFYQKIEALHKQETRNKQD